MVPGANVLINVRRSRQLMPGLPAAMPDGQDFIIQEPARASDPPSNSYVYVPPSLKLSAGMFLFAVESQVDIVEGDHLTAIVDIADEVTPWPDDSLLPNPNEQWIVRYARVLPPPIKERWCWVERVMLGGTLHLT